MESNSEEIIELKFKPRARLLLQLGEQLIRNESIALMELVKNSFDADASTVDVYMDKVDKPEEGTIIIEDNGYGMDSKIVEDVWMEPGSDFKEKLFKDREVSPNFKRLPIGEKGIGRFGVHKLGNVIELTSKKNRKKEVHLNIDWRVFNDYKYLDDVPITLAEREKPSLFSATKTGTSIVVKSLKISWKRGVFRNIFRALTSLTSPFEKNDSFKVNFYTDKEKWLEGLLTWETIKDYSLFYFDIELEENMIKKFKYKFTPWVTMNKLESRIVTEKDDIIKKLNILIGTDVNKINLNNFKIGKIKLKGYIFDLDARVLNLGSVTDKKGLKEYLSSNGGVRVYRDGMRVYDYGEPGNDWLDLDIRRVNQPTKGLSNNIIIATVDINREESTDLKEKTNREGFEENEAYVTFNEAIRYALGIVETLRYSDKQKIRLLYGPTRKSEPVLETISILKDLVDTKVKNAELLKDINKHITKIEDDYRFMSETLLKSAGIGINMSVYIHEIEKILSEIKKVIQREKAPDRLVALIKHLSSLIEGYSDIIRSTKKTNEDLKKLIEQAIFNTEFRISGHKIELQKEFLNYKNNPKLRISRSLVIATLMNLIDNSIYWLDYSGQKNKKIYIDLNDDYEDYISIVIADNGTGFAIPTDELTEPFVSAKPGGMGLGLHIASEVMKANKGKIIFPEWNDFEIPDDFRNGAIVALSFKL